MTIEKRRSVIKAFLAGVISPLIPACATPPSPPETIARGDFSKIIAYLQHRITHDMQDQHLTGLSIALVNDQTLTWTQGFGWADQAAGIPASSQTVYRAGSITKLFTVAAALQFAERGQLDLDVPIQRVLPEFHIGSRFTETNITPRQLMSHHAGLPRDLARGMWGQTTGDFKAVLDYLRDSELSYPPGQVFSYSNLGLSVLGAAIERLANRPFAEHVASTVLQPLGMETASISGPLPAFPTSPYLSKAYANGREMHEPGLRDIAAGGLNASVRDLSRWLMMTFAQGRSGDHNVLREASVNEMLRPQNDAVTLDFDQKNGLGWMLSPLGGKPLHGGGRMASHDGATVNHRSVIVALPAHQLGVVILCNSANAHGLAELARTTLALALEAKTGIRQPAEASAPTWREASFPAKHSATNKLAAYAGQYVTPAGLIRVQVEGRQLKAQVPGGHFELIPDESGQLHVKKRIFGLIPLPIGDLEEIGFSQQSIAGRDLLLARRGQFSMLFGERINEAISLHIPPAWRDMLGIYVPDLAAGEFPLIERITLFEAEGVLNLRLNLIKPLSDDASGALLLQTLSDTQGVLSDKLANLGEAVKISQLGHEKILELSGYHFRKTHP